MGWSNFTKIKKIGEGSFGSAWLVRGNKDSINYVIKIISVSRMPTKEREEARKEVSVLAQMKHPNIVSYIDSFEEAGNLCIVMDYCDGGDLYTKIHSTRGVPHSEEQIIDWFVQITLALKHVHDRKILHRDLKSQNIFLTKDGTVKLGDFGVAKVLTNTMDFARTAIGTPYYMSPELVEHKPYNNKSDVWSLGCVLYELTSMKHPFTANNMQMLAYKILRGNFDPIGPRFSYDLRNLITAMLKRDPRERPSVNGILRKAFIMKRCERFLTNEKLKEEFSHTVLHGENFAKKIKNMDLKPRMSPTPRPSSAASKNSNLVMVGQSAAAVSPIQKIYGAPVVRRSDQQLRQSIEKRNAAYMKKPEQANRQSSATPEPSTPGRPKSYLEQLKERKLKEEAALKKKQKELLEKQKQERIRKAGEAGWQNVLSSSVEEEKPKETPRPPQNDIYARHLKALENRKKGIRNSPAATPRKHVNNYTPPHRKPVVMRTPIKNDFKQRKEHYLKNKARGHGAINHPLAGRHPIIAPRKDEKSDYEEKLRKIREQNYNQRKVLNNARSDAYKRIENNREARVQRIDALRKQGEDQRSKLQKQLEREKIEAEKLEVKKLPDFNPAPPVNMTEVLNAIGVAGKQISKADVLKNPVQLNVCDEQKSDRKSWQKATNLQDLDNKTLIQQTLYQKSLKRDLVSPRKVWDLPHETIIKAFELADLSPSTTQNSDRSLEATKKSNLKRVNTYVIPKKDRSDSSTDETDKRIKNPNIVENSNKELVFSPEKLATLKATKNLLLGVTLGQFDSKSIKLLRTCSEPDMTTLFKVQDKNENDKESNENSSSKEDTSFLKGITKLDPASDDKATLKTTAKRIYKSLEDVNKCDMSRVSEEDSQDEEDETNEGSLEDNDNDENDESDIDSSSSCQNRTVRSNEFANNFDDVSEVANTMASLLNVEDSDEENIGQLNSNNETPKKRCVQFVSQSRLVSAVSVTIDPVDSLEISRKNSNSSGNGDEQDCDSIVLSRKDGSNVDEDPDTEFEDDIVITIGPKSSSCTAEENRINLERELGTKQFIKAYPVIEKIILKEHKSDKVRSKLSRKSYELFKKLFPEADSYLYEQFYDLILSDNELD